MPRIRITEQSPNAGFKYWRQGQPEPKAKDPPDGVCNPTDWDLPQDGEGNTDFTLATVTWKKKWIDIKWDDA